MFTFLFPCTSKVVPPIPVTVQVPVVTGFKSISNFFWSVKLSEAPESINQSKGVLDRKHSEAAYAPLS